MKSFADYISNSQLDELSTNTLRSYSQKAHTQVQDLKFGRGKHQPGSPSAIAKRETGMSAAGARTKKRDDQARDSVKREPQKIDPYKPLGGRDQNSGRSYSEEVDLDEVSKDTLTSYLSKAKKQQLTAMRNILGRANTQKVTRKYDNRTTGIMKARERLNNEEVDLDETSLLEYEGDAKPSDQDHDPAEYKRYHKIFHNAWHHGYMNSNGGQTAVNTAANIARGYQSSDKAPRSHRNALEKARKDVVLSKGAALKENVVAEAGPFGYGKSPRKGSVADLAAKKRKEQEKGKQPIEPRDQQVGTAKVTKGVAEESELGDLAHPQVTKHRFLVTYSDPNHTMVSKRKEKQQKHLLFPGVDKKGSTIFKGDAEPLVKKYMNKQGYRVHEVEHVGMVTKRSGK